MKKLSKRLSWYFTLFVLSLCFININCDKQHPVLTNGYIKWTEGSQPTIISDADTAFIPQSSIDGYNSTVDQHLEIALGGTNPGPSLVVGTYTIGSGPNNVHLWYHGGSSVSAVSGQVHITSNDGDWVNGTFDVILPSGVHLVGLLIDVEVD